MPWADLMVKRSGCVPGYYCVYTWTHTCTSHVHGCKDRTAVLMRSENQQLGTDPLLPHPPAPKQNKTKLVHHIHLPGSFIFLQPIKEKLLPCLRVERNERHSLPPRAFFWPENVA